MFGKLRLLWMLKDLPDLIRKAEALFTGPGRGAEKKNYVLDLVYKSIQLAEQAAGREIADETAVRDGLSWMIDGAVKLANAFGLWKNWDLSPES